MLAFTALCLTATLPILIAWIIARASSRVVAYPRVWEGSGAHLASEPAAIAWFALLAVHAGGHLIAPVRGQRAYRWALVTGWRDRVVAGFWRVRKAIRWGVAESVTLRFVRRPMRIAARHAAVTLGALLLSLGASACAPTPHGCRDLCPSKPSVRSVLVDALTSARASKVVR